MASGGLVTAAPGFDAGMVLQVLEQSPFLCFAQRRLGNHRGPATGGQVDRVTQYGCHLPLRQFPYLPFGRDEANLLFNVVARI
jgi:hypothetical protein